MGRHREFDILDALDAALELFWAQGFQGTSLSDVVAATGVGAPSLYKVFTNKESMFLSVVDRYASKYLAFMVRALEMPTGRGVIQQLLRANVKLLTNPKFPAGCLGVNSIMACSPELEPLRLAVVARRGEFEELLSKRLQLAVRGGEATCADASARDLARYVMTISQGLAVQAKSGRSRAQLDKVVTVALSGLPLM